MYCVLCCVYAALAITLSLCIRACVYVYYLSFFPGSEPNFSVGRVVVKDDKVSLER